MVVRLNTQAAVDGEPRVLVGPVVGTVTATTAMVLLEVSHRATVTCVAVDPISMHRCQATVRLPARRPATFLLEHLHPETVYELRFEGIKHAFLCRGAVTTLPVHPAAVNVVVIAGDTDVRGCVLACAVVVAFQAWLVARC